MQKFCPGFNSDPQFRQVNVLGVDEARLEESSGSGNWVPHTVQNFNSGPTALPQDGQSLAVS